MKFKYIKILLALLIVLGGYAGKVALESEAESPKRKAIAAQKRIVAVHQVELESNLVKIELTGKLKAKNRIQIFSEVNGIFTYSQNEYKAGTRFSKGDILVKLDSEEAKLALVAEKSTFLNTLAQLMPDLKLDFPESYKKWNLFANRLDVEGVFPKLPEIEDEKERLFINSRQIIPQYYRIKSQENKLDKFTIFAPFDGVLTSVQIEKGSLVRAGQKMGEFIQENTYELEAAVSQIHAPYLKVGSKVSFEQSGTNFMGKVSRVTNTINETTQTIKTFVDVQHDKLFEGQFLSGNLQAAAIDSSFKIKRKLLNEHNQVFGVVDSTIVLFSVQPQFLGANTATVKGLKNGDWLVKNRVDGLYEGMSVTPVKETNHSAL